MLQTISTDKAPAAVGPYSQAIKTGSFIFCSGQLSIDPSTKKLIGDTVTAQTEQIFKNIQNVLQAAGSDLNHVIKTTVFLKNMNDFSTMNTEYQKNFGDHKPARSTIEVARLPLDALVEIEVIAEVIPSK